MPSLSHRQVLQDALSTMLSPSHATVQAVGQADHRHTVTLNLDLLLLHSPLLRALLATGPPGPATLLLPEAPLAALLALEELLGAGWTDRQVLPATVATVAHMFGIPAKLDTLATVPRDGQGPVTLPVQPKLETASARKPTTDKTNMKTNVGSVTRPNQFETEGKESESVSPEALEAPATAGLQCRVSSLCKGREIVDLRMHYSRHYRTILNNLYADKVKDGNRCFICNKAFKDINQVVLHIGAHHKKIDGVLWEQKKISIEDGEVTPKKKVVQNIVSKETASNCNYDLKCEVCGKESESLSKLWSHTGDHYLAQLMKRFAGLADGLNCRLCRTEFKSKNGLFSHIGCKHGRVNELLIEKGFRVLPCPLANNGKNSSEIQVKLQQIKEESVGNETLEDSYINNPSQNVDDPDPMAENNLDELLQRYNKCT
jgi:hypothetical protein